MLRSVRRRVAFAVTGCATAPAIGLSPGTAHAAGTFSLVILPDQGESAIYNFINSATKTIDITVYEMRDTTMTTDLVNKQKAGVKVRVIRDAQHTSVNGAAFSTLATFSNLNHNTGYTQHSYSLAPYLGQTITLKFTGAEDYTLQTSFVIDDTALTVN